VRGFQEAKGAVRVVVRRAEVVAHTAENFFFGTNYKKERNRKGPRRKKRTPTKSNKGVSSNFYLRVQRATTNAHYFCAFLVSCTTTFLLSHPIVTWKINFSICGFQVADVEMWQKDPLRK